MAHRSVTLGEQTSMAGRGRGSSGDLLRGALGATLVSAGAIHLSLTPEPVEESPNWGPADGSNIRHIAPCKLPECLDHWEASRSPDGKQRAISTAGGNLTPTGPTRFGLAIVDVAPEKVRQVVDHPSQEGRDHFARWSPDGK